MPFRPRDRLLIGFGLLSGLALLAWYLVPSLFVGWQGCTAIGCWNGLEVVIEDAGIVDGAYDAEVCFEGECQTVGVTVTINEVGSARFRAEGLSGSPPDNRDVDITFRLLEDGVVVAEGSGPVRFRLDRPNGPRCDPVCFTGSLVV